MLVRLDNSCGLHFEGTAGTAGAENVPVSVPGFGTRCGMTVTDAVVRNGTDSG